MTARHGAVLALAMTAVSAAGMAGAVVHRLSWDASGLASGLPERAWVLAADDAAPRRLAGRLAAMGEAPPEFTAGTALMLVSSGPSLDQPDQARAGALRRQGHHFSLDVDHTQVRATGANLERNLHWRPLVQAPLPTGLAPGDYTVTVRWRAVDSLDHGSALPQPPRVQTLELRLR